MLIDPFLKVELIHPYRWLSWRLPYTLIKIVVTLIMSPTRFFESGTAYLKREMVDPAIY